MLIQNTVSKSPTHDKPSTAHLDHDHCESKDVRLLAIFPPIQNLWCSPPQSVTTPRHVTRHRIRVLSDRSETRTHYARMTGIVYKDVCLAECECSSLTGSRTTTYSPKISVNHIAGMEVAEPLCDVAQLVMEVSMG